jgi:DNA (cytosine-5)-methyltransferase 1
MADGGEQRGFNFPRRAVASMLRAGEIVVDLFAGGGGASEALRLALGRDPDIAINHDPWAIGMHAANHPFARHLCEDVWAADPRAEVAGAVGWLHASPDCTHFSQAKGGQPRSRATRSLSWVVLRWAGAVRPRIISLENVEQILKWGPLVAKRDKPTGRVVKLDGSVAARGERVPIEQQFLIPDKRHEGRTWQHFVAALRALGYTVEWRKLRACDYGAGTSRTRLFLIARCDGEPIRWPEPTHGPGRAPFVTAADCIDWSIPTRSIFGRKKDLAPNTLRRIARGIKRFVLDAAEPFIVQCANASANGVAPTSAPLGTITAWPKRGSHAVAAPALVQLAHGAGDGATKRRGDGTHDLQEPLPTIHAGGGGCAVVAPVLVPRYGEREGQEPRALAPDEPLPTIVPTSNGAMLATAYVAAFKGSTPGAEATEPLRTITSGGGATRPGGTPHSLATVVAYIEQANGGPNGNAAKDRDTREPLSTIVGKGCTQRLVTAHLMYQATSNTNGGRGKVDEPLRTVMAGGQHHSVVECTLSPEHEEGALRVAAFLINYYGNGQPLNCAEPADTITTRDRLALVTVTIHGTPYVIVDIGLRMLTPPELYRAQGFPTDYIIDRTADGRRITATTAVRMVGNSVSPPPLCAIARANLDPVREPEALAA